MKFLEKFIPEFEWKTLKDCLRGEEKEEFVELLDRVKKQIRATPPLDSTHGVPAEDIKIWLHYFYGATDIWVYELDIETLEATAFVCLNGDTLNAECGPVYLSEYTAIKVMELDLHWDTNTSLKQVMDMVDRPT